MTRASGALLLSLLSCSSPSPAARARFGALMEDMQEQFRAPGPDSPAALARIRMDAEEARATGWVPDERRRDGFARAFEIFFFRIRDGSEAGGLAGRVRRACRECHDVFKE